MFKNLFNEMCKLYRENEYLDDPLFTVQDVCGPVYLWPRYIKKILTSKTLLYNERLKLTTFLYVNGIRDPTSWLEFIIRIKGSSFRRYEWEINDLFLYYQQENIQQKYFSFCVIHRMYEYLNGDPRQRNSIEINNWRKRTD